MSQYEGNLRYKSNIGHPKLIEGCHTPTSFSITPGYGFGSYFLSEVPNYEK